MLRSRSFFCITLGLFLFLGGCRHQESPRSDEKALISLGFAGPLTGPQANYGKMVLRGAELRVAELNAQPGNKVRYELVRGDDQATPNQAVIIAQEFVGNTKIPLVLGHFNSSCTLAAQKIYEAGKLTNISYGSTNDDVGKGSIWTFRTPYKNALQGQTLARYAASHGLKRVGILSENEDYGRGLADVFKNSASTLGITIVSERSYDSDTTDYRSLIRSLETAKPDAILLAGFYPQLQVAASQAREIGSKAIFLAGDGVGSSLDYIKNAGTAAEGTVATGPFLVESDRESVQRFRQAFKNKHGEEPDSWAIYSYDSVGLADHVISKGITGREEVRNALSQINSRDKAVQGLVGPIWFDENGDAVNDDVSLAIVKNGRYVVAPVR